MKRGLKNGYIFFYHQRKHQNCFEETTTETNIKTVSKKQQQKQTNHFQNLYDGLKNILTTKRAFVKMISGYIEVAKLQKVGKQIKIFLTNDMELQYNLSELENLIKEMKFINQ